MNFASMPFGNKAAVKSSKRMGADFRNVFGFAIIVPENYAILMHRFKKYHKQLEPGFNFKIPFIDTVEYVHDLRE